MAPRKIWGRRLYPSVIQRRRRRTAFVRELLLAPILSAGLYASALSSYFISDDYAHLFTLRLPLFETLAELTKAGQDTMFLRPAGFVALFLDHRIWGHEPFGYHLTNLLLHLISVVGVYFLCRNLGLDNETSAFSSLMFSILPQNSTGSRGLDRIPN